MLPPKVRQYIDGHKLCAEYIFRDWEEFLDLLYAEGGKLSFICWWDHCLRTEQFRSPGRGGYIDKENPEYMFAETALGKDGLENVPLAEIRDYVRMVIGNYPECELVPSFYPENDEMSLSGYDNKYVRITDVDGEVFEGIAYHNSEAYCFHEFGRFEECLQLVCFLFYKSDIQKIEVMDGPTGPYGHFSAPYGALEEQAVEEGYDLIDEFFSCEEEEHVLRMLRCLEKYLDPASGKAFPDRDKTLRGLQELRDSTNDDAIREAADKLLHLAGF
ncbi:MAG: hypothetical protein K6E83_04220 [Clostridium sp.]|nr:hypothetical protein [Clostridium sp.]